MSEDPPKYSDSGEQVDYQVIKSEYYARASRPLVRKNLYIIGIIIFVLICLMTIFQTVKIRETLVKRVTESEKRVTESEKRVTELEKRVTELETKLTKIESQRAR